MKTIYAFFIIVAAQLTVRSQVVVYSIYKVDKMQKSVSFASTTFGLDILTLAGGSMKIGNESQKLNPSYVPRLTIGGTHFWGHADFYVHFPIGINFSKRPDFAKSYALIEAVETGAKFYPWAMKPNRLVPYAGISFQPFVFKSTLKDKEYKYGGATYAKFTSPLHIGLSYMSKNYIINLGARYHGNRELSYYISPTETALAKISPVSFNFGIVKYINTNKSLGNEVAVDQLNKKHHILKKHKRLSAWYAGIGPSAALEMSKSSFIKSKHPYFYDNMLNSFLMPELSFGRYLHKVDMNISTSFRHMNWSQKAFDTELKVNRYGLAIEPYKFLLNYHGFVPLVGPSLNIDKLTLNENGKITSDTKTSIGIVFGWDIRVSKTESWLLRTNLRYVPNLHLNVENEKLMFNHLEFNFIQYVHFFGRNSAYNLYRNKNKNQ